jgi:hypothetical protein
LTDAENHRDDHSHDWNEHQIDMFQRFFKSIQGIQFVKVEQLEPIQTKFEVSPNIINKWEKQLDI